MLDMAPRIDLTGAAAVTRGLRRMFARHQLFLLPEVPLRNGRRADGMGLDLPGLKLAKQLYEKLAAHGCEDDGTQALFKLYQEQL